MEDTSSFDVLKGRTKEVFPSSGILLLNANMSREDQIVTTYIIFH